MLSLLKLGGSLITDKDRTHTARPQTLLRLAGEIREAMHASPDMRLIIGHGSGSFGHVPAKQHGTRKGVHTPAQWQGFIEVWREAHALNQIVLELLTEAGLPVVSFPPSASIQARGGAVHYWDLTPIRSAVDAGLIPLIFGDVIFDDTWGGTILSTEELFFHLAAPLKASRILIAGIEPGVWLDYPACTRLISEITPANFADLSQNIQGSASVDVTGGMLAKVESMLALVQQHPGLEVLIFPGTEPGLLTRAMCGENPGTRIHNPY